MRFKRSPNTGTVSYIYPGPNESYIPGSGLYSDDEIDSVLANPGAYVDNPEDWEGGVQPALFQTRETGKMAEPKNVGQWDEVDERWVEPRSDFAEQGNYFSGYHEDESWKVAQALADSGLPREKIAGHDFKLEDEDEDGPGGWYQARDRSIGLTPDYFDEPRTIVHELGHSEHIRGNTAVDQLSLDPNGARSTYDNGREAWRGANAVYEGVADAYADRYHQANSDEVNYTAGYTSRNWKDPLDRALYDTTRHVVGATGQIPQVTLPNRMKERASAMLPQSASRTDTNRVAARLLLTHLLDQHPDTERDLSVRNRSGAGAGHSTEFKIARDQELIANNEPSVQLSMLTELVDPTNVNNRVMGINPEATSETSPGSDSSYAAAFDSLFKQYNDKFQPDPTSRAAFPKMHYMDETAFGQLGSVSPDQFLERPSRVLRPEVIPTGEWARGIPNPPQP